MKKEKKTGLHVFYKIWEDAMNNYQKAEKDKKAAVASLA